MTSTIIGIIAGLLSSIYNILNRIVLKTDTDSTVYGWITESIRLVIGIILIFYDSRMLSYSSGILHILLLGLVEILSVYLFMKMHLLSHLSLSTLIQRTRLIWIPILAFIILGERLKTTEYIGIFILFIGLCISVAPKKILSDPGIKYSHFSAFIVAVLSIVLKSASEVMSIGWVLVGMSLIPTLVIPFTLNNPTTRIISSLKNQTIKKFSSSCSNTFAMILYSYALKIGDVSKISAIYQSMMIVSIVFGVVILKEREELCKKITGTIITVCGVYVLTIL